MKVEVLLSTMHQKNMDIFGKMNIQTNALAVNQYDYEYKDESINKNENVYRMISLNERGLSKSRNLAIHNSNADICIIADEDVVYRDNYAETIVDAHEKHPDADIIAFSVPSSNMQRSTRTLKRKKVNILQSMRLSSVQLSFKRESIIDNKISFNTLFGAGSTYPCGEENIFLAECLSKGLKIIYINSEIATVHQSGSTWFKGFDRSYFKTKGALFYKLSKVLWFPLILQFAVRKYKRYKTSVSFLIALKYMLTGGLEYRRILAEEKKENEPNTINTKKHSLFLVREETKK